MFDNFVSALGDRFRQQYPQGSIISDLVQIHGDQYVVKVSVLLANTILVSTLAADANLTLAENRAIERALTILGIWDLQQPAHEPVNLTVTPLPDLLIGLANSVAEPEVSLEVFVASEQVINTVSPESNLSAPVITLVETSESPIIIEETLLTPVAVVPAEPIRLQVGVTSGILEQSITTPDPTDIADEALLDETKVPTTYDASAATTEPSMSVTDMIPMINMELKRLGWSKDRGREYMVSLYNKRARDRKSVV